MGKKLVFSVCAAIVFALALLSFWPTAPRTRELPNPNGYDLLISGAEQLTEPLAQTEPTIQQLQDYVVGNSNALRDIKKALKHEFILPTTFDPSYMNVHIDRMPKAKAAAKALVTEGKLAEIEGRYADAAEVYMQAIALGRNVARNGLVIDMLVAATCEGIGAAALERIIPKLTPDVCKPMALNLEAAESNREAVNAIIETEHQYMRSFSGFGAKLDYIRLRFKERFNPASSVVATSSVKYQKRINDTKLLAVRLASRAHEAETGKKPTSYADLVPIYLKAVPTDAQTDTPLTFNFSE